MLPFVTQGLSFPCCSGIPAPARRQNHSAWSVRWEDEPFTHWGHTLPCTSYASESHVIIYVPHQEDTAVESFHVDERQRRELVDEPRAVCERRGGTAAE